MGGGKLARAQARDRPLAVHMQRCCTGLRYKRMDCWEVLWRTVAVCTKLGLEVCKKVLHMDVQFVLRESSLSDDT